MEPKGYEIAMKKAQKEQEKSVMDKEKAEKNAVAEQAKLQEAKTITLSQVFSIDIDPRFD
jgi:hypothetical protein